MRTSTWWKSEEHRVKKRIVGLSQKRTSWYRRLRTEEEASRKKEKKKFSDLSEDLSFLKGTLLDDDKWPEGVEPKEPLMIGVTLNDNEKEFLSLGPKFAIRSNEVTRHQMLVDIAMAMSKERWSRRKVQHQHPNRIDLNEPEDEEFGEETAAEKWQEHVNSNHFNFESKTVNFGKVRSTNLKLNKRIKIPTANSPLEEAQFEIRTLEIMKILDKFLEGAGPQSNLTENQQIGLKSLQKRVKNKELLVIPTDKSGRLAAVSMKAYLEAGRLHTSKDKEINIEEAQTNAC